MNTNNLIINLKRKKE